MESKKFRVIKKEEKDDKDDTSSQWESILNDGESILKFPFAKNDLKYKEMVLQMCVEMIKIKRKEKEEEKEESPKKKQKN